MIKTYNFTSFFFYIRIDSDIGHKGRRRTMTGHTEFSEDANKENVIESKKKWKTPHTFVILIAIILVAAAATYFIPAGEFTRYEDEVTGKTLVEAGSYHTIASPQKI